MDSTDPTMPWPIYQDDTLRPEAQSSGNYHISQSNGGSSSEDSNVAWPPSTGVTTELPIPSVPAKVGTRFSTRALRILKNWFAAHEDYPYPRSRDIESLQHQTGLSKLQINTWLTNARRRTKSRIPVRPTSPGVLAASTHGSMKIPPPQHPVPLDQLDPLGRWENSPPEEEAADVTAILNAVSGSAGISEAPNPLPAARPQPSVWGEWSSASSAGTSNSSHSSGGSAYSQGSNASRPSSLNLGSWPRHKRRRKRTGANAAGTRTRLSQMPRKFQCTFCTESFAQKHAWQRHEKSMHLSLERWECSPEGPYAQDNDGHLACAYCAELEPDLGHLATHNYQVCAERPSDERSFYRKDHLIQHLRAVHHVKFDATTMGHWQQTTKDVKSSCGFCGLSMSTWNERANHLADHFKSGATMAEWLGDWGFDADVVEMVQNSIAPYLIDFERNSPWPFTTDRGPPATPPSAFELIKMELDAFSSLLDENGSIPSQDDLLYESCCIILGSETLSPSHDVAGKPPSWLRELLMSSEDIVRRAHNRPLGSNLKDRVTELRINGKANIFDSCNLEEDLRAFVQLSQSMGSLAGFADLQREAGQIVERVDAQSRQPSALFVTFLNGLIHKSAGWLESFRQRAGLVIGPSNMHGNPEDAYLSTGTSATPALNATNAALAFGSEPAPGIDLPYRTEVGQQEPSTDLAGPQQFTFLSTDTYYWGLRRGLAKFVAIAISPRNPQCHIPTDEELQRQARWIMFDSDDTWDQTPADNPEWLLQFKRDNGLVPE